MASGPRHLGESFVSTGLRFTPQVLSDEQKTQAQTNIGAQSTLVPAAPIADTGNVPDLTGTDLVDRTALEAHLLLLHQTIDGMLEAMRENNIISET